MFCSKGFTQGHKTMEPNWELALVQNQADFDFHWDLLIVPLWLFVWLVMPPTVGWKVIKSIKHPLNRTSGGFLSLTSHLFLAQLSRNRRYVKKTLRILLTPREHRAHDKGCAGCRMHLLSYIVEALEFLYLWFRNVYECVRSELCQAGS